MRPAHSHRSPQVPPQQMRFRAFRTSAISLSSTKSRSIWYLLPPMKSRASGKRKEDIAAGPSSSGKLAYDRVETYLVTTEEGGDDTVDAKLSLYARAIRNQKGLWFKIVQDLDDIAQIDFFDLSIGQAGENSGETSNENSGPVVSVVVKHLNA